MGDTVPDISTDAKSESDKEDTTETMGEMGLEAGEGGTEAAPQEDVGELACPKCGQIYAGPASLKRHLWRIHRLAGDEAQALVDEAIENPIQAEAPEPEVKAEEEDNEDKESNSGEVKSLLAVSLSSSTSPKVRPLLSLSPEPPAFQGGGYGGSAPWMMSGGGAGANTGGGAPQTGLLPTPGPGMGSTCPQTGSPEMPSSQADDGEENSESGSGKVPALMSIGVTPTLDQGGIKPLMSIPVEFPPYMMSPGMGMGYGGRFRRRERRHRPYNHKNNRDENQDLQQQYDENEGNIEGTESDYPVKHDGGDPYESEVYQSEEGYEGEAYDTGCGECGLKFDDPASLADHEPCSESVSIDLNCDVDMSG